MVYRQFYTLLFYCLLPAILLRLLYRSIKAEAYRHRWAERFGIFPSASDVTPTIWLHAVSVGETLAALPLIKALRHDYPDQPLVITTTTPTGSGRVTSIFARDIADKKILHVYAPYDIPFALDNFLDRLKPRLLIVMETELWPNMINRCARRNIPVVVANARLSEKSAKGYRRIGGLVKTMLREITMIVAQNNQDAARFVSLGFAQEKLLVSGSIKFDLELTEAIRQQAEQLKQNWSNDHKRRVFLAASTHPGEDEMLLEVFKRCRPKIPDLLFILVPRHPERFNAIYQLCLKSGFRTSRWSVNKEITADIDIVLGDTMGELLLFYGACDLAFVGGSLVPVGGHNPVEPAAWGKPVISGKHVFNFSDITDMLKQQQALHICETVDELYERVENLLLDEPGRTSMGIAAQKVANENRGALQRLLTGIKKFLK